jgi:hypothetical protein
MTEITQDQLNRMDVALTDFSNILKGDLSAYYAGCTRPTWLKDVMDRLGASWSQLNRIYWEINGVKKGGNHEIKIVQKRA